MSFNVNVYSFGPASVLTSLAATSASTTATIPNTSAGAPDAVRVDGTGQSGNVARKTRLLYIIAFYEDSTPVGPLVGNLRQAITSNQDGFIIPHNTPILVDCAGADDINFRNYSLTPTRVWICPVELL